MYFTYVLDCFCRHQTVTWCTQFVITLCQTGYVIPSIFISFLRKSVCLGKHQILTMTYSMKNVGKNLHGIRHICTYNCKLISNIIFYTELMCLCLLICLFPTGEPKVGVYMLNSGGKKLYVKVSLSLCFALPWPLGCIIRALTRCFDPSRKCRCYQKWRPAWNLIRFP